MKTFTYQIAAALFLFSTSAQAKWWNPMTWGRNNNNGGNSNGNQQQQGRGFRGGQGQGQGLGNGGNQGDGMRGSAVMTTEAGVLDSDEVKDLLFMREEEKMARDVYETMFDKYPTASVFARIAISEQAHMDSMQRMIDRYDLTDPVVDDTVGVFQDKGLQNTYNGLVAKGNNSLKDALMVGALIEEIDINDLKHAMLETDESALDFSYGNLMRASENHLRAFVRELRVIDSSPYVAQNMTQAEVDGIILN